jgi:hypothetical protein
MENKRPSAEKSPCRAAKLLVELPGAAALIMRNSDPLSACQSKVSTPGRVTLLGVGRFEATSIPTGHVKLTLYCLSSPH